MKVLILDNYDSYTYNLYQYAGEILLFQHGEKFTLDVIRNDEITIGEIEKRKYDRIIISPGPGEPSDESYFGVCGEVITKLGQSTPVLGVCLGMQGIAHFFGGKVIRAFAPMHGKTSPIEHDGKGVFKDLPQNLEAMRYHSLMADPSSIPDTLMVTAKTKSAPGAATEYEIMGLRHKTFPVEGIQFHPESFGTDGGLKMIENFFSQS